MYTYIAQDIHGNWFVSKQSFPLREAAEAEARIAESTPTTIAAAAETAWGA